jgi:hypothetical protein
MVLQAALKDKILSEELEFEELLKADDDGDGDVSQSEYILYKLEQVYFYVILLILLNCYTLSCYVTVTTHNDDVSHMCKLLCYTDGPCRAGHH